MFSSTCARRAHDCCFRKVCVVSVLCSPAHAQASVRVNSHYTCFRLFFLAPFLSFSLVLFAAGTRVNNILLRSKMDDLGAVVHERRQPCTGPHQIYVNPSARRSLSIDVMNAKNTSGRLWPHLLLAFIFLSPRTPAAGNHLLVSERGHVPGAQLNSPLVDLLQVLHGYTTCYVRMRRYGA